MIRSRPLLAIGDRGPTRGTPQIPLSALLLVLICFALVSRGEAARAAAKATPRSSNAGFTILYQFQGAPDGYVPGGRLTPDAYGDFFGATLSGGIVGSGEFDSGYGTLFELTPSGSGYVETVIHDFDGTDGAFPSTPLEDAYGNLFAIAVLGGFNSGGTAVKLTPSASGYSETALLSFSPLSYPNSLLFDNGGLYGSTTGGGSPGGGSIFSLSTDTLSETVLHSFPLARKRYSDALGLDGVDPSNGALLGGLAFGGGKRLGTIFDFSPSSGTLKELYVFKDQSEAHPGALFKDATGNIYGIIPASSNFGQVFRLTPMGKKYELSVLHTFMGSPDGEGPSSLTLIDGVLYGTTGMGGTHSCYQQFTCGTIFRMNTDGTDYAIVHDFSGTDGFGPEGLVAKGRLLYGAAGHGGLTACAQGCGLVFSIHI